MTATPPPRLRNKAGEPLGEPCLGGWMYTGTALFDAVHPPSDWGPWELDTDTWVLYPTAPYRYEVDLERCLTSAYILSCIVRISRKTWADDATVAGLIRALGDVLKPQANLCPGGTSAHLTKTKIRELARQAHEAREQAIAVYRATEP